MLVREVPKKTLTLGHFFYELVDTKHKGFIKFYFLKMLPKQSAEAVCVLRLKSLQCLWLADSSGD